MPTIKFNGSKFPDYMYQVGTQKSSGTFSQTYKLRFMHTNFDNEINTEPNVDRQNNIIIGIAIGVTIMICGVIYLAGMVMSS